ncbi:unnamed protein product, partial [Symbiodinium necroappetens]
AAFRAEHEPVPAQTSSLQGPSHTHVSISNDYDLAALRKEFSSSSQSHSSISASDDERWLLYCKTALMLQRGDFKSLSHAEQECAELKVSRQKLSRIMQLLKQQGTLPCECPRQFKMGQGAKSLTLQEKEDLLEMIRFHSQCGLALSIRDLERAIMCFRMAGVGVLNVHWDSPEDLAQKADAMLAQHAPKSLWKHFREWVQAHKGKEDWMKVRRLKQKPLQQITAVTEKVIVDSFDEIQEALLQSGIAKADGDVVVILESESHRLAVTDEKGVSQRCDDVSSGVLPANMVSKAKAVTPNIGWTHLTMTSFLPLKWVDGQEPLPVGVVVPFAKVNPTMSKAWPSAVIRANPTGSTNASLFAEFVEKCYLIPMRRFVPQDLELMLIFDSGGGQWLHISSELVILLLRYKCRAYVMKPYTTGALCPLDQDCHKTWAKLWADTKSSWARNKQCPMNVYQALEANSLIAKDALSPARARASWHACGFDPGMPLQRDKVLIERRSEVIQSVRGNASTLSPPQSKNQKALDIVATISPPKTKCQECNAAMTVVQRHCGQCGAQNAVFNAELYEIHRNGHRSGWQQNAKFVAEAENEQEERASRDVGDLLHFLRCKRRLFTEEDNVEPPSKEQKVTMPDNKAEPQSKNAKSQPSSSHQPEAPALPAMEDSDSEFDLNDPSDCLKFLEEAFPAHEVAKAGLSVPAFTKIMQYFIRHLRARKGSLAAWMRKEVITPAILDSKSKRASFLAAWSKQRSTEFVPKKKAKQS